MDSTPERPTRSVSPYGLIVCLLPLTVLLAGTICIVDLRTVCLAVVGIAWSVVCLKRPLWSFNILLFAFLLAYARLELGGIEVEGSGNRGAIALGDILWLTLIVVWGARDLTRPSRSRIRIPVVRDSGPVFAMLPFVVLATGLPIIGIFLGGWPISYAIPGFRQLQWVSFVVLGYSAVRSYGPTCVLRGMTITIAVAALAHTAYAIIQLGYSMGWLSSAWVVLDTLFSRYNANSWFYYPRLTGLLVNPNSYGLWGAFLFIIALAISTIKGTRAASVWIFSLCGGFALIFSASRSALLGLGIAMGAIMYTAFSSPRLMRPTLKSSITFILAACIAYVAISAVIPSSLTERFIRFVQVCSEGVVADPNAIGRAEMWKALWRVYILKYPFGTWVPTSYATGSAVDSFYVATAVQGTPLFTLAWLGFLYGGMSLGGVSYRRLATPTEATVGLTVLGWSGIMAGSGLTLSPMLQPQLIVLLWTLIGVLLGCQRESMQRIADGNKLSP